MGFKLQHLATSLTFLEDQSILTPFDRSTLRVVSLHDRTPRGHVIICKFHRQFKFFLHYWCRYSGPQFSDNLGFVWVWWHAIVLALSRSNVQLLHSTSHCPPQSARRKCDRYIVDASTPVPSITVRRHCSFLVRYIDLSSASIEILRCTKLQLDCCFEMTFITHTIA